MKINWKNLLIAIAVSILIVGLFEYIFFLPDLEKENNDKYLVDTYDPTDGLGGYEDGAILHKIHDDSSDRNIVLEGMIIFAFVGMIVITGFFYSLIQESRKKK